MNKWFTLPIALLLILSFTSVAAAHTHAIQSDLTPDLSAYCMKSLPYQLQQQDDGWNVYYIQALGDPLQNNWKCSYEVYPAVPIPDGANYDPNSSPNSGSFVLPPFTDNMPVDWNALCNQQYPGAYAQWMPGPEVTTWGQPWVCVGQPGVIYDPAEQADGTHNILSQ